MTSAKMFLPRLLLALTLGGGERPWLVKLPLLLLQPSLWLWLVKLPLLLPLLLSLPFLLTAQHPLHFNPVFRNYSTDQGLPNNWTYAIEQDREGYLWVSTDNGVCRFNGYRFEQFPDTLQANYTSVMSKAMMEDECGRMWWVDFQGHVFYQEYGRIHLWKHNALIDSLKLRFDRINHLIVSGCGKEFWFSAHNLGVLHIDSAGHWKLLPRPAEVTYHFFEKEGRHFACAIKNSWKAPFAPRAPVFFQTEAGHFSSSPLPNPPASPIGIEYITKFKDGSCFIGLGSCIYLIKNGNLQWYRTYDQTVGWIFEDDDGSLLVGHLREGGVARFESIVDLRLGKKSATFLEGLSVANIFKDREGGYWFGTQERGLFYCSTLNSGIAEGLPGIGKGLVKGVVSNGNGRIYAGLQNGQMFELDIARNKGRDITPGTINFLYTLYFDTESQTLACAAHDMSVLRQGKWLENTLYQPSRKNYSATMGKRLAKVPGQDQWWTAHIGSVSLGDWRKHCTLESSSDFLKRSERFFAVCLDQSGRLWVSTRAGLSEYKNHELLRPSERHPAFEQSIFDIITLPDSSLAIAPKGYGVIVWKPGYPPLEFNEAQGLVSNKVYRLFAEPDGSIWACTNNGASRISPLSLGGYRIENFTVRDGLPSNVVNQVAVAGGFYWFATDKGLLRLQPKLSVAAMPAPLFESISVNNRPYMLAKSNDFRLPYDSANVSLEWVSLHFRSVGQIRYRYRLLTGRADTAWAVTTDRRANFANLAPGSYQFEVAAQDEEGAWSAASTLALVIRPPWWATWWAGTAAATALCLLFFALYRYRTNQIRTENRITAEMQRLERSALQAQMNPHFIFNCLNSIQNFILQNDQLQATQYLSSFARLVRDTLNASVNGWVSLEEEIRMLNNYLALEKLRFKEGFDYSVEMEEGLDGFDLRLPPLLIQPMVENAILHGMKNTAGQGFIRVQFREEGEQLVATVTDNGSGLIAPNDAPKNPTHRPVGMGITQKRLALLNPKKAGPALDFKEWHDLNGKIGGMQAELRIPIV